MVFNFLGETLWWILWIYPKPHIIENPSTHNILLKEKENCTVFGNCGKAKKKKKILIHHFTWWMPNSNPLYYRANKTKIQHPGIDNWIGSMLKCVNKFEKV